MRAERSRGTATGWTVRAWLIAGCAVALGLTASVVEHRERRVTVHVECSGNRCSASAGGMQPLVVDRTAAPEATRFGLYLYHHHDDRRPQYLRNLRVQTPLGPLSALALDATDDLATLGGSAGWSIQPGKGLTHQGTPGERATILVEPRRSADVVLDVDVDLANDAGVLVRASGPNDGLVFTVRDRYNDAFFFEIEDGRPGPILALAPLRELAIGREALRLGGLIARIVCACGAGMFLLGLLLRRVPARSSAGLPVGSSKLRIGPFRLVVLFGVSTAVMACVALWGFDGVPHLADETAYLFQAKVFAAGQLWAPVPVAADFFLHEHLIMDAGRWFAKYPPLFPLFLSFGVLAGLPWLVNPLLGAATATVVFRLTERVSDSRWGLVAWLLTMSSPFFLIMGGSLMSHMAAALCVSLSLLCVVRWLQTERLRDAGFAGACLGLAFLTRPYTALLVGLAVGSWLIASGIRRGVFRAALRATLTVGLCAMPFVTAYVGWTRVHAPIRSPSSHLHAAYDSSDTLGFGPDKGRGWLKTWGSWGHSPAKALRSVHGYLDHTSRYLLGWPAGLSFVFILVALAKRRSRRRTGFLFAPFIALALGHMLYWATQHIGYGARYWFSAVPALLVLSALGLREIHRDLRPARPWRNMALAGAVLLLVVLNLSVYFPSRFAELHAYAGIRADLALTARGLNSQPAVIFVKTEGLLYNDGFFMNDPFLQEPRIYARDLGPRNVELLEEYPQHRAYRWDGVTLRPLSSFVTNRLDGTSDDKPEVLP